MRAKEFIDVALTYVDAELDMYDSLMETLNLEPHVNLRLFEGVESIEIHEFFNNISADLIVGQQYYISLAAWIPVIITGDKKIMKFNNYISPMKLVSIHKDPHYVMMQNNNQIIRFPAIAGKLNQITNCTLLFNTEQMRNQSEILIDLKFSSEWRILRYQK